MDKNVIEKLRQFGFSESEAKVYLAVLALEKSTVDAIARKVNINRTSCYSILERLKEQGIASQVKKGGKSVFKAAAPEKLLEILDEKRQSIETILPELSSSFEIYGNKPEVRFYEGKEGLKTVLNVIIRETKEVLIYGDGDSFKKAIPGWTSEYSRRRVEKNMPARIILKASESAIASAKRNRRDAGDKNRLNNIRVIPEALVADNSGFDVFADKVVIYTFAKKPLAVVVSDKIISKMMKLVFESLWREAEKYNQTLLRED